MTKHERPEISPLIRRWMPDASEEEQRQATENLRGYVEVLYRIFLRIEREKNEARMRDKNASDGRLESPTDSTS